MAQTFDKDLTGSSPIELSEVDSWLDFAQVVLNTTKKDAFNELAQILEDSLNKKTYLVANRLTIADISIYSSLKCKYYTNGFT